MKSSPLLRLPPNQVPAPVAISAALQPRPTPPRPRPGLGVAWWGLVCARRYEVPSHPWQAGYKDWYLDALYICPSAHLPAPGSRFSVLPVPSLSASVARRPYPQLSASSTPVPWCSTVLCLPPRYLESSPSVLPVSPVPARPLLPQPSAALPFCACRQISRASSHTPSSHSPISLALSHHHHHPPNNLSGCRSTVPRAMA